MCADLGEAARTRDLEPEDTQRLATSLYLTGKQTESTEMWARAHQMFLDLGAVERAARSAFWLAFQLTHQGERVRAAAWVSRASRLLEDNGRDCVELGYLLLPRALQHLFAGDPESAFATFARAAEIGQRFADADLIALACHSLGRVLIRLGKLRQGVGFLDEAMVGIEAGEVSPLVVGDVYCSVIEGCLEIFDLRRAQEWTSALARWCDSQPDLVPFRGQCLIRRAEILQLHGAWSDAQTAAGLACQKLLDPPQPASGAAFYCCGELHRLRGEITEAEEAYRQASRHGRKPQPGLALLRLLQGQAETAANAIRLALDEATGFEQRVRLLPACVEIMLAAGELADAQAAAEELDQLSTKVGAEFLKAQAAQARGAILLAKGDNRAGLSLLREACAGWQKLEVPYEVARTRVLIGLACRQLGDKDAAEMEFDAARWLFQSLDAQPGLDRLETLVLTARSSAAGPLTARELEVLRLVATGKSNRSIASELYISTRTVERHLSNIFSKLDVSSRSAATAYAYRHNLL